jgi:hypothetical protein
MKPVKRQGCTVTSLALLEQQHAPLAPVLSGMGQLSTLNMLKKLITHGNMKLI